METRPLDLADLNIIGNFHHSGEFPLPDVTSPLYFVQKAIIGEKGEVLGAAFAYLTNEITIVLNQNLPAITRTRAVIKAFEDLKRSVIEKHGFRDSHVFILPETNIKFASFLERRFGFQRATGIPLYYRS